MFVSIARRSQYTSHLSRVHLSTATKVIPSRIEQMIQYVQPGKQIETKILEQLTFVSLNNTPVVMQIVQGDITQEETDAIVNPTDQFL